MVNVPAKRKKKGWGPGKVIITILIILFAAFMIFMFVIAALDIKLATTRKPNIEQRVKRADGKPRSGVTVW
jgi:hypothetical protein